MNKIFFITGASGAGKTTTVKNVEESKGDNFLFCYFDTIGVPSLEDMNQYFGGPEEWQRVKTQEWVKRILDNYINVKPTILDGQIRPEFIDEACKMYGITNYIVVLFDCSDDVRKQRLIERGHPELANEQMIHWSKYLREQAKERGYEIIDNTDMTQEEGKNKLLSILEIDKMH